jgi:hypothetical protein
MGRTGIQMIENLQVYDMIWGLTNVNRFCGKADRQVSVAAHSMHCFNIASAWQPDNYLLQLYCLVHDLPEAYYGDFPGFLKKDFGPDFKQVLDDIDDKIFAQLGLDRAVRIALGSDCHRVDVSALTLEAEYAFDKFQPYHWPPIDLYDNTDLLRDILDGEDNIGMYNQITSTLEFLKEHHEPLQELLHRHRSYSHPRRDSLR